MAIFTFCGSFEDVKIANFQFKTISDHSRLVKHDSKSVQGQLKRHFIKTDVSQSDLCIFLVLINVPKMYQKIIFVSKLIFQLKNALFWGNFEM